MQRQDRRDVLCLLTSHKGYTSRLVMGAQSVRNSRDKFGGKKKSLTYYPNTLFPICHQPAHKAKNLSSGWQHIKAEFNNYLFQFSRCFYGAYYIPDTLLRNLLHWNRILEFEKDFHIYTLPHLILIISLKGRFYCLVLSYRVLLMSFKEIKLSIEDHECSRGRTYTRCSDTKARAISTAQVKYKTRKFLSSNCL